LQDLECLPGTKGEPGQFVVATGLANLEDETVDVESIFDDNLIAILVLVGEVEGGGEWWEFGGD
jgi:hypothetical protein